MRPRIRYESKNRLIEVARDVSDDVPDDRDVSVQEALTAVLDHVESDSDDDSRPDVETMKELLEERNQQQQSDPFGGRSEVTRRRSGNSGWR